MTSAFSKEYIYPVAISMAYAVPKSSQIPNIKEKLIEKLDNISKDAQFAQTSTITDNGVKITITYGYGQYVVTIIDEKALKKSK